MYNIHQIYLKYFIYFNIDGCFFSFRYNGQNSGYFRDDSF